MRRGGWAKYIQKYGSPNKGKKIKRCIACGLGCYVEWHFPGPFKQFSDGLRCSQCYIRTTNIVPDRAKIWPIEKSHDYRGIENDYFVQPKRQLKKKGGKNATG